MEELGNKLTLKERQQESLKILIDVAKFCDANNISYFLGCGTLLGAIRHKGFIPWDDDIDILMFRDDYRRFEDIYNSDDFILQKADEGRICYDKVYNPKTVEYEKDVDYKKNKPIGIAIDIFPLDGIVNDHKIIGKLYKKECFLEMLLRLSNQPLFLRKNPLKCANRLIPRAIGSKNIVKMIQKNQQVYTIADTNYVVRMKRSNNGFTGALPLDVYKQIKVTFEGYEFYAPEKYDIWLKSFFGDYMKLPPKEKQIPHERDCYYIN